MLAAEAPCETRSDVAGAGFASGLCPCSPRPRVSLPRWLWPCSLRGSAPRSQETAAGFVPDRRLRAGVCRHGTRASNDSVSVGWAIVDLRAVGDDVWIIGRVAWHWDGIRWGSSASESARVSNLESVDATAPTMRGLSGGGAHHRRRRRPRTPCSNTGTAPVEDRPPPRWVAAGLESVSADSPSDVWAIGWWVPNGVNRHRVDAAMRPLVAHWDGHHWHVILSWRSPERLQ